MLISAGVSVMSELHVEASKESDFRCARGFFCLQLLAWLLTPVWFLAPIATAADSKADTLVLFRNVAQVPATGVEALGGINGRLINDASDGRQVVIVDLAPQQFRNIATRCRKMMCFDPCQFLQSPFLECASQVQLLPPFQRLGRQSALNDNVDANSRAELEQAAARIR